MTDDSYEAGLRDGKLQALEAVQRRHEDRLNHHEKRLQMAERVIYGLIGAIALIELIPILKTHL